MKHLLIAIALVCGLGLPHVAEAQDSQVPQLFAVTVVDVDNMVVPSTVLVLIHPASDTIRVGDVTLRIDWYHPDYALWGSLPTGELVIIDFINGWLYYEKWNSSFTAVL